MTKPVLVAIDQGTTGTTVLVLDERLQVISRAYREFPQVFPKPGWVEHELPSIWASVQATLTEALAAAAVQGRPVAAIGITNQRETVAVWDKKTGEPVHNAIVWQCRRTADLCETLRAEGLEPEIRRRTGLLLDPYFSGTKLRWLLDEVDGLRARAEAGTVIAGTIDSYLVWRLTGGAAHVTDVSNASRTQLFDLKAARYDPWLLDALGVPESILPKVCSSSEIYGRTAIPELPEGIPVAGVAGDQQAALFGQACFEAGDVKCTYGTGAFILANVGTEVPTPPDGLLATAAWRLGPDAPLVYALEGAVFCAGAAVQWLRDGLGIIASAPEVEALAESVEDTGDVVFVPALTGLGAPHWRPEARGIIRGLTRDTTRAHLARATLEGIALQCFELMDVMAGHVPKLGDIRVDGGAAANNLLMQLQADLIRRPVIRPAMLETTALGAAMLAGLAVGYFESLEDLRSRWASAAQFSPRADFAAERLLEKWRAAVTRA